LGSRFFGLTPEYKFTVYNEVHDLVYWGNGGFLYSEVYNMPIHIRRYHIRKINEHHEQQNEEHEKAMRQSAQVANNIPKTPNIPKNLRR
jgi:hypothetical protein